MKPVRLRLGWREFFGDDPYPYDLAMVERRDGVGDQVAFLAAVLPEPPAIVLDVACGRGRHAVALAELGYRAVGIDAVHANAQAATKRSRYSRFATADMHALPFRGGSVGAIVSMYTSLGYDRPVNHMLSEAARVTRRGGMLVLDVLNRAQPIRLGVEPTTDGVAAIFQFKLPRRVQQVNFALRPRRIEIFSLRYPVLPARRWDQHLRHAGWRPTARYGNYDFSRYTRRSPRLIMVSCLAQ